MEIANMGEIGVCRSVCGSACLQLTKGMSVSQEFLKRGQLELEESTCPDRISSPACLVPYKRVEPDCWELSESFDLVMDEGMLLFRIKTSLEPNCEDPFNVDLVVGVQNESTDKRRVLLFDSLKYTIIWHNIGKDIRRRKEMPTLMNHEPSLLSFSVILLAPTNKAGITYFNISGRYGNFCRLDELFRGEGAINDMSEETGPFDLLSALVKVELHFTSYSPCNFTGNILVFPSAAKPDYESEDVLIEFPTINMYGEDSEEEYDDDSNDCTLNMCPDAMDYYLHFLNPTLPCYGDLVSLKMNVQVNCELAAVAKSVGLNDLLFIISNNLLKILDTSLPFTEILRIWNIASKYSVCSLETKCVEVLKRRILSSRPDQKERFCNEIRAYMKQCKLKICSLSNLFEC